MDSSIAIVDQALWVDSFLAPTPFPDSPLNRKQEQERNEHGMSVHNEWSENALESSRRSSKVPRTEGCADQEKAPESSSHDVPVPLSCSRRRHPR